MGGSMSCSVELMTQATVDLMDSDSEPAEMSFDDFGSQSPQSEAVQAVTALFSDIVESRTLNIDALEAIVVPVFVDMRTRAIDQLSWYFPSTPDDYRPLHVLNTCRLAVHFAQVSGMDDSHAIQMGIVALLYDIGMWLPEVPPVNEGRALTQEEMSVVEGHCVAGAELLESIEGIDSLCARVAKEHHERADKTGYPTRSGTDDHHPYSRLIQIIDSFLGMIETRSFRKPVTPIEAMQRLAVQAHRGYYHMPAFRDWLRVMGVFPVGTFITLNTGELAIVSQSGGENLRSPRIQVLADELLDFRARPMEIDLNEEPAFEISGAFTKFPHS